MTLTLTEGIVDKLIAYYQANLPAKVRVLNTEYNDNTSLKVPTDNAYFAGIRGLLNGPDYPRVSVIGEGWSPSRYSSDFTDGDHRVRTEVAVKSDNADDLQRQMYRFGRAIWELTVARFFASTADDFFALHGDGDITIDFEAPEEAATTTQPYLGRAVLTATYTKQENN